MARMISWRKVNGDYRWRSKSFPEQFKIDCKFEIIAGVTGSTLVNRHPLLIIEVKNNEGKYIPTYSFKFKSSWYAKNIVDNLLSILRAKDNITPDEALQWFINELKSFKKIEELKPSTDSYASELGYYR